MTTDEPSLSLAVTHLFKGVVYRDTHEVAWRHLVALQPQVRDYVGVLGLTMVVDEAEGYAYLRSRPEADDADATQAPRLVPRRSLSFPVSLLLVLLRKKLLESDAKDGSPRLLLTRDQIVEMVRVFLPEHGNEARMVDQIDSYLKKVEELGFLRRVRDSAGLYEVRRILKAFVDGQWLADLDAKLAAYAATVEGGEG
jgi:hypothetical protein